MFSIRCHLSLILLLVYVKSNMHSSWSVFACNYKAKIHKLYELCLVPEIRASFNDYNYTTQLSQNRLPALLLVRKTANFEVKTPEFT
jgi:hypothetical protein